MAEEEWLETVVSTGEYDLEYEDYLICAKRLSHKLKYEEKCDLIIALTHMRVHNDLKLCEEV